VFLCFSVVSFSTYIYVHHFTHAEEFAVTGEMRTQRHFTWFINCGMLLTVRLRDIFQRKIIRSRRLKFFNRVLSLVNFIGIRLRNVASRAKHRKNALEVAPPSPFGFSLVQMETIIFFIIICFTNNFSQGWHFFIFLPEEITSWNSKLENSVSEMKMPAIENIVGRRIVGYYGELPAPMMYNDFYFKASPATISFVGWNRWIIEKDAEFFRNNDSAPPYLVYQLYNVGDRSIARQFAPQDDPMAQLEIFRRYDPVRDSHGDPVNDLGRLLLKRRDPLSALQYDNLEEGTYLVGDWIQVPKYTSEPIQAVINITRSFFGELVSYVYKPPIYFFCYRLDNGVVGVRKFTPIKATEGFLVAPLILENKDFLSALSAVEWNKYLTRDDSSLRRITEFRISCGYVSIACANRMKVQFNKVYGLGFGRDSSGH
jgi:hypothetical protein